MSNRYGDKGFNKYPIGYKNPFKHDRQHIWGTQKVTVDCSVRDNTLLFNIFANLRLSACYICDKISHTAGLCPITASQNHSTISIQMKNRESKSQGRARVAYQDRDTCNYFNSLKGCENARCGNAYVYLRCQGYHLAQKCNNSKKGQVPRSKHQRG